MTTNADFDQLTQQLHRWNGRRKWRDGLLWLPRGLLAGLMVAVVVAVVARIRPFLTNTEVAYVAGATAIFGLIAVLIWLLLRRFNLLEQAQFADFQFELQERSSTAVEIQQQQLEVPTHFARMQLTDAVTAVQQVDTKSQFPFQFNRQDWLILLVTVGLLITAVLLPNPQEEILKEERAVKETITEQIEALEALEEEILANPELTQEQQEELLEPLEGAIQELGGGEQSREEAVATLSEAEADLRELQANNSTNDLQQSLQDAGQPLAENEASESLGQSLQNGNLAEAGAAAAQLADDLPELSEEEQAELAQDLAETAASLEGVDSELAEELAAAASALQNGDVSGAQQALQQASGTLQQRAQSEATASQAGDAASQLSEGRQEVAQAGQEGQSGQGQQAEGQQGQQGQQGQSGEGQSGEGQSGQGQQGQGGQNGQGSGNGQGQGQGSGSETGTGTGGTGEGGGHAENVFVPDFVDLSGEEGTDIELPAECLANPSDCGGLLTENPSEFTTEGSTVPYDEVFGNYSDAANEALQDDYIPLGLKGYIRDYFSSLEP